MLKAILRISVNMRTEDIYAEEMNKLTKKSIQEVGRESIKILLDHLYHLDLSRFIQEYLFR